LLDTMDSRPGVGDGFPVSPPNGGPAPAPDQGQAVRDTTGDR
jgi:hypothetical protein